MFSFYKVSFANVFFFFCIETLLSDHLLDTQVYAILDEVFLAGEIEETSKQVVLDRLDYLEKLD